MMITFSHSLLFHFLRLEMLALIVMTSASRIFLRSVSQLVLVHVQLELLASKVNLILINNELRQQQRIMLHLRPLRWALRRLRFILLDILYVNALPLRMLTLPKLPVHASNAQRHICFRPLFFDLVFKLLMQTHSSIADQDIVDLFKVKINVIMMMSVMSFVFLRNIFRQFECTGILT